MRRVEQQSVQGWRRLAYAAVFAALILSSTAGMFASGCGSKAEGITTVPSGYLPTGARSVSFTTEDGVVLEGHVFGSGGEGVILSHMYPADQTSWYATAQRLAGEGYLVLTYDFRGYGDSAGTKQIDQIYKDVEAAVAEIRREGAAEVVLVGASMGGTASLVAGRTSLSLSSIRLAGVATLSAPVEFQGLSAATAVPALAEVVPLLFIAAEKDAGAAGARALEQYSSGKGGLEIVPGADHGTDLLNGAQGDAVYSLLLGFLREHLGA